MGWLFGPDIKLLAVTLKRLKLAVPDLLNFSVSVLNKFWQNFSKIDWGGGGGGNVVLVF